MRATVLLAALGATALAGCYTNAHGLQSLPHVIRVESEPAGARLLVPAKGLLLTTPCDIEMRLDRDERIIVEKAGYHAYHGPLRDLYQSGRNTFTVTLRPLE